MDSDVSELLMNNPFEEVRCGSLLVGVEATSSEITPTLPIGRIVAKESRSKRRAAVPMLLVPPDDVVRPAHLDANDIGPSRIWETLRRGNM